MVGLEGLEPSTSRLSGARSSHLSYRPLSRRGSRPVSRPIRAVSGGDEGNRTPDPLLAGQVLSQLSYTPVYYRRRKATLHAREGASLDRRVELHVAQPHFTARLAAPEVPQN